MKIALQEAYSKNAHLNQIIDFRQNLYTALKSKKCIE